MVEITAREQDKEKRMKNLMDLSKMEKQKKIILSQEKKMFTDYSISQQKK